MSPYDQKIKQLIEATPFWEKDGGGIRGRTIAPLLGGTMGSGAMEESLPQQFNQQTNRSFAQQEEGLPDLILPSMGGGETCIGFGLYTKDGGVWVNSGTINGEVPDDFIDEGKNIASGGSGDVWVEVVINEETGEIVSTAVGGGGGTPEDDETTFYYTLGRYEYNGDSISVTNYACGSVEVTICRNWFAAEAPFYGVTITRCGCGGGGY